MLRILLSSLKVIIIATPKRVFSFAVPYIHCFALLLIIRQLSFTGVDTDIVNLLLYL